MAFFVPCLDNFFSSFRNISSSSYSKPRCTQQRTSHHVIIFRHAREIEYKAMFDWPEDEDRTQYTIEKPVQCEIELRQKVEKLCKSWCRKGKEWYVTWKIIITEPSTFSRLCWACTDQLRRFVGEIIDGPNIIFPSSYEDEKSLMLVQAVGPCGCETGGDCVVEARNSVEAASSRERGYSAGSGTAEIQLREPPKYQK